MTDLGLMSNSELLRIKNKQKAPYKKQKTASSYYNYTLNGLMTDLGLILNVRRCSFIIYIFLSLQLLGWFIWNSPLLLIKPKSVIRPFNV